MNDCRVKVIVSKSVPSFTGGWILQGPTANLCAMCGTDHGETQDAIEEVLAAEALSVDNNTCIVLSNN